MDENKNCLEDCQNNNHNDFSFLNLMKKIYASNKKLVIFIGIIVAILLIVSISGNVLFGDDKIAYDMVLEASDHFKDPSSVRLVWGYIDSDRDGAFDISANNSWGARGTNKYCIGTDDDGEIYVWEADAGELAENLYDLIKLNSKIDNNQGVNVDKINKALDRKWG